MTKRSTEAGPLVDRVKFSVIADALAGKSIYYMPPIGRSVGSMLGVQGTLQFFEDNGVKVLNDWSRDEIPEKPGPIDHFVYGGGIVGNLPGQAKYNRGWLVTKYLAENDIHVIGLPMSHLGGKEPLPTKFTLFAREEKSLAFIRFAHMAPDMSLYWRGQVPVRDPDGDVGIFLRNDDLALVGRMFGIGLGDPADLCNGLDGCFDLASRFEEIRTDRLMFAICGLLIGRKVILLPDKSHKNRSFWESWLKHMGCGWLEPPHAL